jgi:SnoaL-like domain
MGGFEPLSLRPASRPVLRAAVLVPAAPQPAGDRQASQWPFTGRHHQRDPILPAGTEHPSDVVADYQAALAAGDVEAIVAAFEPDGYFREPSGPQYSVRGTQAMREFFTRFFSAGGGIGLEHCTITDDGTRCALEYNCVRWGSVELPPPGGRCRV